MLIFIRRPEYITPYFMEQKGFKQMIVYNLSSMREGFNDLDILIPDINQVLSTGLADTSSREFDLGYAGYILNNDIVFAAMMSIIMPLYVDPSCLIAVLIGDGIYTDDVMESLIKFIQQRYGYNSSIINTEDDLWTAEDSTFSIPGLFNMKDDMGRWLGIRAMTHPEEFSDVE